MYPNKKKNSRDRLNEWLETDVDPIFFTISQSTAVLELGKHLMRDAKVKKKGAY